MLIALVLEFANRIKPVNGAPVTRTDNDRQNPQAMLGSLLEEIGNLLVLNKLRRKKIWRDQKDCRTGNIQCGLHLIQPIVSRVKIPVRPQLQLAEPTGLFEKLQMGQQTVSPFLVMAAITDINGG